MPNHFNLPKSCFGRTWGNHSWELCHRYKVRFIYSSTFNTEIIRKSVTDERNLLFGDFFFFLIWFTFYRVSVANLHFQQGLNAPLNEVIGQMNTKNESVLGLGSRVHVLHASAASWGFQNTMLSVQSLFPGSCSLMLFSACLFHQWTLLILLLNIRIQVVPMDWVNTSTNKAFYHYDF